MSDFDVALGLRLREARKASGLGLDEMAARVGVTRSAVGHWEAGKRSLNAEQVVQLAGLVGADPAWLLTGTAPVPTAAEAHRLRAAERALAAATDALYGLLDGVS